MTDALSVGWTQAQAATRRAGYRRLLGLNLILQAALGLLAIAVPVWLAQTVGLGTPPSAGWVRLWGVMLLILAVLYVPGFMEPVHARWPNLVGVVARFVLAAVYAWLGRGFRWLALYELLFAVLLAWSYGRLMRAELMSRP
jgi:hypothetical protein